jgi:hypothetical protein
MNTSLTITTIMTPRTVFSACCQGYVCALAHCEVLRDYSTDVDRYLYSQAFVETVVYYTAHVCQANDISKKRTRSEFVIVRVSGRSERSASASGVVLPDEGLAEGMISNSNLDTRS